MSAKPKQGRPKSLTTDLATLIRSEQVRSAISAQTCGSYSSTSPDARWHVVETHPAAEHDVLVELTKQKFQAYLPMLIRRPQQSVQGTTEVQRIDADHVPRPRRSAVARPVFPRYLFVRFDRHTEQWRPITSTFGVRKLISYSPERPIPVPDAIVEALQAQGRAGDGIIDSDAPPDANWQPIAPGTAMQVLEGPFTSFHGICTMSAANRVHLLLSLFGRETSLEYGLHQVRVVS